MIKKSSKYRKCKKGCDIWSGDHYYPQRKGKAICLKHGRESKFKIFLSRIKKQLNRLIKK